MAGGFMAFRCSNYDTTPEREQFRLLCKKMKAKYAKSEHFYILAGNYNIYDSELDAIVIKHDSIIAVEFKNYGGTIVATENGDWTANGVAIRGGSRKTVYQQARINHASLKNGLKDLGINKEWIKDIPSLIVFNQTISLDNQLSGRVQSWLHITDNAHFLEKIEDITCSSANLSNIDIIDLAIRLNLNEYIVQELSAYTKDEQPSNQEDTETIIESPQTTPVQQIEEEKDTEVATATLLKAYDRFTPNHVFSLRPQQIFVFGTDTRGSQRYGAAGMACKNFGAQIGVVEGPTGSCYALPTKGFQFEYFEKAVKRFKEYVESHPHNIFLITPVGCGHAGFNVNDVASLFKEYVSYENVMLPKLFIDEYISSLNDNSSGLSEQVEQDEGNQQIKALKIKLSRAGRKFNTSGSFVLKDEEGRIIAEAELGIEDERIVFLPFNSQSERVFKNHGYSICSPDEYLK